MGGGDALPQLEGQGIVREKPDDHTREIYTMPTEIPDDQIHELPANVVKPSSSTTPTDAMDGDDAEN